MLLSEHGLADRLASVRGMEQQENLVDFAWRGQCLRSDDQVRKVDPAQVVVLMISHGHIDHDGALLARAKTLQEQMNPGLTPYAGIEDTFCHRWTITPGGEMRGPRAHAMCWRCGASRSRRVFSTDNLPHVLTLHTLAEFARRMIPLRDSWSAR